MAKTTFKKKIVNGQEYYFYRLRHKNLNSPKDIYAKTVKELKEKIAIKTKELEHGITSNKDYFGDFLEKWLFNVKFINLKPSSKERYESTYRIYLKDSSLSKIKLTDITSKDIQSFYNKIYKKHKSISKLRNIHKLVAPCIRYAYNNNLIIKDFTSSIVFPKDNSVSNDKEDKINPFTLEEQKQFIKAIKGHELEMLFLTALNTGMRQGELFALKWGDINFEEGYISVTKNMKRVCEVSEEGRGESSIVVQTPKTKSSIRNIDIPALFRNELKQYKLKQTKDLFKLGIKVNDNTFVFLSPRNKHLAKTNVLKKFKKILKDNNIQDRKFHDLRHTYATRLFELGESPKVVQTMLGHSNISITLDTYTHVLEHTKKKAVDKLNDLYLSMRG